MATKNMDTASSSNQHIAISQQHSDYFRTQWRCCKMWHCITGWASGSWNYKRTCHLPLKMKLTWYLHNDRNSLTCDTVSHLRRKKCSIRPQGQALSEPAHTVRFRQSHLLGFTWLWLLLQRAVHFWWWYCGAHSLQTHCQTMWPTQKPSRASSVRRDRQTLACLTGESKSSIIELSPY